MHRTKGYSIESIQHTEHCTEEEEEKKSRVAKVKLTVTGNSLCFLLLLVYGHMACNMQEIDGEVVACPACAREVIEVLKADEYSNYVSLLENI